MFFYKLRFVFTFTVFWYIDIHLTQTTLNRFL